MINIDDNFKFNDKRNGLLSACPRSLGGYTCQTFNYKGVLYPKGTCSYVDSYSIYAWCSIDTSLENNGPWTGECKYL